MLTQLKQPQLTPRLRVDACVRWPSASGPPWQPSSYLCTTVCDSQPRTTQPAKFSRKAPTQCYMPLARCSSQRFITPAGAASRGQRQARRPAASGSKGLRGMPITTLHRQHRWWRVYRCGEGLCGRSVGIQSRSRWSLPRRTPGSTAGVSAAGSPSSARYNSAWMLRLCYRGARTASGAVRHCTLGT